MTTRYKMFSLGYEILDHCNLNCQHCCHFSNLKEENEKSLQFITEDIEFLNRYVELDEFKISGGEPLIHSNISGIIVAVRRILGSKTKISLLTNGLKLASMPDEFYKKLRFLNIVVSVAKYPINAKYDEAEAKMKQFGVLYGMNVVTEFGNVMKRIDPEGHQDPDVSYKYCRVKGSCPYYNDKHISICRASSNVPYMNEHMGYKLEFNLVKVDEPHEVIRQYLTSPCKTCRFCKGEVYMEPWTTT